MPKLRLKGAAKGKTLPKTPTGKYKKLKALGSDKFRQIKTMLLTNTPMAQVAEVIQDEWGEYQDIRRQSLVHQLKRLKADLQGEAIAKLDKARELGLKDNHALDDAIRYAKEQINAADMANTITMQQYRRVQKLQRLEDGTPYINTQLTKELQLMMGMVKELHAIQADIGIVKRVPKKVKGEITLLSDEGMEERERMSRALDDHAKAIDMSHSIFKRLNVDPSVIEGYCEGADD